VSAFLREHLELFWAPDPEQRTYFHCHEPVEPPAVWWQGATSGILLHAVCAEQLGCHLIADSREAMLASGQQPWTRRAGLLLRDALQAQEGRRS
jgi:hypothetical protein